MPYELHFVSCVASLDAVHTNSIAVSRVTGPTTGNITSKSRAKSLSKNKIKIHCQWSSRWPRAMQDCGNSSELRMELRQFGAKLLIYVCWCCQIWMWFNRSDWYLSNVRNIPNTEINKQSSDLLAPSPVYTAPHLVANIDFLTSRSRLQENYRVSVPVALNIQHHTIWPILYRHFIMDRNRAQQNYTASRE